MAWVSFGALSCRKKKTWWQLASRCCRNRARPWHASELVSFLFGLMTHQHPGIWIVLWNLTSREFLDLLSDCWLIGTLPRRVKLKWHAADFALRAGCIQKHGLSCSFECYIHTVQTRSQALSSVRMFCSSVKTYALRLLETSGNTGLTTPSLECYGNVTGKAWELRLRLILHERSKRGSWDASQNAWQSQPNFQMRKYIKTRVRI